VEAGALAAGLKGRREVAASMEVREKRADRGTPGPKKRVRSSKKGTAAIGRGYNRKGGEGQPFISTKGEDDH